MILPSEPRHCSNSGAFFSTKESLLCAFYLYPKLRAPLISSRGITAFLAQLGERTTEDRKVPCSIHVGGIGFLCFWGSVLFFFFSSSFLLLFFCSVFLFLLCCRSKHVDNQSQTNVDTNRKSSITFFQINKLNGGTTRCCSAAGSPRSRRTGPLPFVHL